MVAKGEVRGPVSMLKAGSSWFDDAPKFKTQDSELAAAARMLWQITRKLRARQGERGYSDYQLGWMSGVRRQTVADVMNGASWADSKTLGKIAGVLGLELTVKDVDLS